MGRAVTRVVAFEKTVSGQKPNQIRNTADACLAVDCNGGKGLARGQQAAATRRIFFRQFYPHPQNLPHNAPSFLPGTLRSRSKAGKDRRLRLVTDEVTGPGRPRPRVPLPPLRAVRAGRAHSLEAKAGRPRVSGRSGTGADRNRRTGGREVAFIIRLAIGWPPVFPVLSLSKDPRFITRLGLRARERRRLCIPRPARNASA
jgi:hypothetical protein